ncbi:MAG TPA: hypothetical protein PKM21_14500 [Anaerolineales bacterium]|nr:hypothetical protein [Anaerolineales bacterium]
MGIPIPSILKSVFPFVAAGAIATIIYLIAQMIYAVRSGAARAVTDFRSVSEPKVKGDKRVTFGTKEHRIQMAFKGYGLDVGGWEQPAVYLAIAVIAVGIAVPVVFLRLPFVLLLLAPFLGFVIVNAVIDGKWSDTRMSMEKEIPTVLIRLSSLLKANPNVIETLGTVAQGLDPEKPLKVWIERLTEKMHKSGQAGLKEMQDEAELISPSLLLTVVLVGRAWETGGKGYGEALRLASDNLADLMETRSQAQAVAAGAWGTSRTILMALGVTLLAVLLNPVSRPSFSTPLIQAALAVAVIWGGFGYWQIRDAINLVTE